MPGTQRPKGASSFRRGRSVARVLRYGGGTERGTALARVVVVAATPLRAQRGDVAERPPAPWGFQVVLVRLCSRHRTPHHRSVTTALVWCADTRTAQALAPSGDCSPEPPPFEGSSAGPASSSTTYTLTRQHRDATLTTTSAIPSCAGTHCVSSAAQRRQNAFHPPTMGIGPAVSPTLRTHWSEVLQLAASPTRRHTIQVVSSPSWLPNGLGIRQP